MKIIKSLASIAVLALASNSAYAAGTTAGTGIDNTASISYSVGGTPQGDIASSPTGNSDPGTAGVPTTFVVDKKIDLVVTGSATDVPVAPGATTQAITYTVTNEGNSTEDFDLSVDGTVTGDAFDLSACTITDPATSTLTLIADQTATVTVECTIPDGSATVVDGALGSVDLLANIGGGITETAGTDTAGAVDVVFADSLGTATDGAAENGSHSAISSFVISSASLIVTKTEAVSTMWIDTTGDGVLDTPTTGNFFHIPGAEITYTITVSNADGAADATDLIISDPLTALRLEFVNCAVSGPVVGVTCSNSVPLGTDGGTVTTSSFTLPGGSGSANVQTLTIVAKIL